MRFLLLFGAIFALLQAELIVPQTFEANFTQSITNEQNSTLTYSGNIKATIDKKALWAYEDPIAKKIYYNSGEYIIIEDELEQAIFGKDGDNINFFDIFKKAKKINEQKFVAQCCEVEFTFITHECKLQSLHYKDKMDNHITIKFSNVLYDVPLDDSLFVPNIPEGYDLLRR
jgi:outer membrane lipoprotein carrier protein